MRPIIACWPAKSCSIIKARSERLDGGIFRFFFRLP
jgi:hypothetical protein